MKKLVMMCAIVAAAVSVRAATYTWGGAICDTDGSTALSGGQTAYLLYSDTAFGSITTFYTDTLTTDGGGTMVQSHAITAAEAGGYVFTETYTKDDYTQMNGNYAVVLVSGSDMYYATFSVSEFTSPTTPMQDYKLNADWSGYDFIGDASRSGTATNSPEPTSGLLLLIGAGLLGLRRKRA